MSVTSFAGQRNAWNYAYGINPDTPALTVLSGSNSAGTYSLILGFGYVNTVDGTRVVPAVGTPIIVGNDGNQETVTPTAVSNPTPAQYGTCTITATFAFAHGNGDQVKSGTVGLQEALNAASAYGGGVVLVDAKWAQAGGTNAMLAAAVAPAGVAIEDSRSGLSFLGNSPSTVTQLAAPTALSTAASTNGLITTASVGGAIPASSTYRLAVTYVDANGGETTISTDSASTATIATSATSTNTITVTSPAALTGAVGYRVYMSAASGASLSEILYPVGNAAITGTVASGSPTVAAFAIGTPVTITAIITGTAKIPTVNSAYAQNPGPGAALVAPFTQSFPPFVANTTTNAAATANMGLVNLPAGYLNSIGRTVRLSGNGFFTTNGTGGTVTFAILLASVPGVTSVTLFTAVSGTIAGSALTINYNFVVDAVTAAVGASGTLEVHGYVVYNVAGTAVGTVAVDSVQAVSSAIDLTKQDQLEFTLSPTTAGLTASQQRQTIVEVLA